MMDHTPPEYLGTVGQRKWAELLGQLSDVKDSELDSLGLLCSSWEQYLSALKDVNENGQVCLSEKNGRRFVNPSVNVMNEAWKQITKLSKGFGLQPESRAPENKNEDGKWNGLIEEDQE